ncbi:hypothetical protein TWF281_003162 [Arthrobotrys megalospora]
MNSGIIQCFNPKTSKRRYDRIKNVQPYKSFVLDRHSKGIRHKAIIEALKIEKGVLVEPYQLKRYLREWGGSGKNLTKRRKAYLRSEIAERERQGKRRHGVRFEKSGRELNKEDIEEIMATGPAVFQGNSGELASFSKNLLTWRLDVSFSPGDVTVFTPEPETPGAESVTNGIDEQEVDIISTSTNEGDTCEESPESRLWSEELPYERVATVDTSKPNNQEIDNSTIETVITSLEDIRLPRGCPTQCITSSLTFREYANEHRIEYLRWLCSWQEEATVCVREIEEMAIANGLSLDRAYVQWSQAYESRNVVEVMPYCTYQQILGKEVIFPLVDERRLMRLQKKIANLLGEYFIPMKRFVDRADLPIYGARCTRASIQGASRIRRQFDSVIVHTLDTIRTYGYPHVFTIMSLMALHNLGLSILGTSKDTKLTRYMLYLRRKILDGYKRLEMEDSDKALTVRCGHDTAEFSSDTEEVAVTTFGAEDMTTSGQLALFNRIYEKYGGVHRKTLHVGCWLLEVLSKSKTACSSQLETLATTLFEGIKGDEIKGGMSMASGFQNANAFHSIGVAFLHLKDYRTAKKILMKGLQYYSVHMGFVDLIHYAHDVFIDLNFDLGLVCSMMKEYRSSLRFLLTALHSANDVYGMGAFTVHTMAKIADVMQERGPVLYLRPALERVLGALEGLDKAQNDVYNEALRVWMHCRLSRQELSECIHSRSQNEFLSQLVDVVPS